MRQRLVTGLLLSASLALPATVLVGVSGGSAFAASTKPSVTCTGLSGSETKITLTGCNDTSVTGGSGMGTVATSTTKWHSGKTTIVKFSETLLKSGAAGNKCAKGLEQVTEVAKVGTTAKTGGTATALYGQTGGAVVCLNTTAKTVKLLAGSKYAI